MKNWLQLLEYHDFTGVKAKEQWQKQIEEQQVHQMIDGNSEKYTYTILLPSVKIRIFPLNIINSTFPAVTAVILLKVYWKFFFQVKEDAANTANITKDANTTSQQEKDSTFNNIENEFSTDETKLKEENGSKDDFSKDIVESDEKNASNGETDQPPLKKLKATES